MRGNSQVRFLGEGPAATLAPYPTTFLVTPTAGGEWRWQPLTFLNDYVGVYQVAGECDNFGHVRVRDAKLARELSEFSMQWDLNLKHQGFIDQFHRRRGCTLNGAEIGATDAILTGEHAARFFRQSFEIKIKGEALDELHDLGDEGLIWADCEALERRHAVARGTLIVLDAIPADPKFTPSYRERREFLESLRIPQEHFSSGIHEGEPRPLLLTTSVAACDHNAVLEFYFGLKEANRKFGCEFFEGVVMKMGSAAYPVQLRSSTEECRAAVKHRFIN